MVEKDEVSIEQEFETKVLAETVQYYIHRKNISVNKLANEINISVNCLSNLVKRNTKVLRINSFNKIEEFILGEK